MANDLRFRASIKDDVSNPLERIKDKFGQIQKAGAKPFLQGLAIGGGIAAFNALGGAIQSVTGYLGDSIAAAREEQVGISKLDASLKANIAGYDGNRDAIEKVISSREKLAFSDGEQRDSLAVLLARTKDVNQALGLQRQAMDLARLKGIDLATASDVVGKVFSGNVGILARYGIAVRKGSTATEALGQISKAAAGQAEAFADTAEGSMQSASIALENLSEEIGTALLPVMKALAMFVRDEVVPALTDVVKWFKENESVTRAFGMAISSIVNGPFKTSANEIGNIMDEEKAKVIAAAAEGAEAWDTGSERIAGYARETGKAFVDVGDDARDAKRTVADALRGIVSAAKRTRDDLNTIGSDTADVLFDPLIAKAELAANKREQAEARATIASKKSTREQVRDARTRLTELQKDAFKLQVELIGWGKMNKKEQASFLADLKTKWKTSTGDAKAQIKLLIDYINGLNTASRVNIKVSGGSGNSGITNKARAGGGPVNAGGTYLVGENGPEILRMGGSSNGMISPSVGSSSGGGVSLTINVSTPALTPGGAQALADAIAPSITRWQQMRGL